MRSILNPDCVGGPGRLAARRCSERYTAAVAVCNGSAMFTFALSHIAFFSNQT